MKRSNLAQPLQRLYRKGLPCGGMHFPGEAFQNLWFVVPPPPPRKLPKGVSTRRLIQAAESLGRLPSVLGASQLDRLAISLQIHAEAVTSSRIEGTWSTIDHVLTPSSLTKKEDARSERASVVAYAEAILRSLDDFARNGVAKLNLPLLRKIHRTVASKDPAFRGTPGKIRGETGVNPLVFIGGLGRPEDSVFNPPAPPHVLPKLREVLAWMSDDVFWDMSNAGMGLPLAARLAIGHAHFEAVHPFPDGNGRVGRILLAFQVAAMDRLPPYLSGYLEVHRSDYMASLKKAQQKLDYAPIIDLFSEAVIQSVDESLKTREAILALPDSWRKQGGFRAGSAAERACMTLMECPVLTVSILAEKLDISIPAANHAVQQLTTAGILRERTGFGRNRVFGAEEVLAVLSRPFGEKPETALRKLRD